MRRTVFIILGIAGGIVALVLVAVAIAVATVDVNSFAQPLAARITAATGRAFTISGPLDLHLSLEPTLRADNVSLGNAPWAQGPAMITAKRIEAQVALLPLLHRRFEVVRVTLVDPVISLETDAHGNGNWVFQSGTEPAAAPSAGAAAAAPAIGIGELEIRNGALSFRDGATGKVTPVTIEALTLRSSNPDAPVTGEFRGSVDGVPIALKANLGARAALLAQQWPYPIDVKGQIAGRNATLVTKMTPSGATTRLDDLTLAYGDLVMQGSIAVDHSGPRARYVIDVKMPRFAPEALALPAAPPAPGKGTAAPKPAASSRHLVPDEPIPLAGLRNADAQGHISIGTLMLAHGQALERLELRFTLQGGRLDVTELTGAGLGGTLAARGVARVGDGGSTALDLHLEGRDLDLKPVLALAGAPREVSGGKTRATLDAKATGASLHQWLASMDGTISVLVGPAQLRNLPGSSNATLDRVSEAVNPFRKAQGATELKCAVIRLPVRDGVARVDRGIALETAELGVSASGTLDFRNETLDLALKPQVRQGIPINVAGLADVVRVRGSFEQPQISIDPVKSAESIARIGAVIGTGGWSLLGETLLSTNAASDSPCAIALGAKSAAPSRDAANPQKAPLPADLGKALGKLFGR
jgi:uncharacterized protein involved in outer membrane biogenesis